MAEEHHETHESKPKQSFLSKYKWWLVGALAVIAVLVFFFTSKSNSNAAAESQNANSGSSTDTSGDMSDLWSELEAASMMNDLEGGNGDYGYPGSYEGGSGSSSSGSGSDTSTVTTQSTSGMTQPGGPEQKFAYGQDTGGDKSLSVLTSSQAKTLLGTSERPYIWNGSSYVPASGAYNSSYTYYSGPMETQQIAKKTGPFK